MDKIRLQFLNEHIGAEISVIDSEDTTGPRVSGYVLSTAMCDMIITNYEDETCFDALDFDIDDPRVMAFKLSDLTDDQLFNIGCVAFPMFTPFEHKDRSTIIRLALTVLDRGHLSSRTRQTLLYHHVLIPFTYVEETLQYAVRT